MQPPEFQLHFQVCMHIECYVYKALHSCTCPLTGSMRGLFWQCRFSYLHKPFVGDVHIAALCVLVQLPYNPLIHMLTKPHHEVAYAQRCDCLLGARRAGAPLAGHRLVTVSDREAALFGIDRDDAGKVTSICIKLSQKGVVWTT